MTVWRGSMLAALVTIGAVGAACDGDGGSGGSAPSTPAGSAPVERSDPAGGSAPGATDPATPVDTGGETTDVPPGTEAVTTTIGVVSDTGVPGIDSADVFCRSWSEFAGSFQALALATSFGSDPQAAARLEVAAAPAVIAAVERIDANLPDEIESERDALVDDLLGPMVRRAERARAELVAAGVTDGALAALGDSWLVALTAAGVDQPDIPLAVPDSVDVAGFDAAVDRFAAALPAIDRDPSLITDASIPLTERYLAENCPDQGTLAGNDVIDEI